MIDPLTCRKCRCQLESDDAVSIIEGICAACRRADTGDDTSSDPFTNAWSLADDELSAGYDRRPNDPTTHDNIAHLSAMAASAAVDAEEDDLPPTGRPATGQARQVSLEAAIEAVLQAQKALRSATERPVSRSKTRDIETTHRPNRSNIDVFDDDFASTFDAPLDAEPANVDATIRDSVRVKTHQELEDEIGASPISDDLCEQLAAAEAESTGVDRAIDHHRDIRPPTLPKIPADREVGVSRRTRRRRRDLLVGFVGGLAITLAAAGYLISESGGPIAAPFAPSNTARELTLRVTPPWSEVMLDGERIGIPDEAGKLTVSLPIDDLRTRWLEIAADGYHPTRRPIASFGGVDEVFIELDRTPYEVAIRSTPEKAEVWLDDVLKGYTPVTLTLLPTDSPALVIRKKGFQEVSRDLRVPDRGKLTEMEIALAPAGPTLQIDTNPPGAMVMVDGIVQGPSPLAVTLDSSYRGKEAEITATLEGYFDATSHVALPVEIEADNTSTVLNLELRMAQIEVWTTPPGGRVIVDGEDKGPAPVTLAFDPAKVGSSISVAASLAGSHYGRQEVMIPPTDEPMHITIPLEFEAHRVVFVIACAEGMTADAAILADQAVEAIHRLKPEQRFAILLAEEEDIDAWPGGLGTEAATNAQKIRAFDVVRGIRPYGDGAIGVAMRKSLEYSPNTIWLFTSGDPKRDDLFEFADDAQDRNVAVHIVRTASSDYDEWFRKWTAEHRGTYTILGQDAPPAIVLSDEGE